jgi:2'-5' RNA ligase
MNRFLIAIPLPHSIQSHIARICCGIPGADWEDEGELKITIKYLDKGDENLLLDLIESLQQIQEPPFFISLEGMTVISQPFPKKSHLCIPAVKSEKLITFNRYTDPLIKKETFSFQPHVVIAKLEYPKSQKVFEYLHFHFYFKTELFLVDRLHLYSVHNTPKRTTYTLEAEFPLMSE